MAFYKTTLTGVLMLVLSGCTTSGKAPVANTTACNVGSTLTQTTLYFGLSRPAGADVSAAEWQHFVDYDVTPRFRDGLTVFSANGQWLGNNGKLAREQSKALMLIHEPDAESNHKIEALREVYKSRFGQDSVMRVDTPACVAF